MCGAGSGELLACAVQAYAGPGDAVLFPRFSFSLYPLLAMKVGAVPVPVAGPPGSYGADVDTLLAAVTPATRVVLLDNPNNPVGSWLDREAVARLHAGLPGDVLLILDGAYAEYRDPEADDGALALAAAHGNVLVTRTFSKAFGLASERVGWATGAPELIGAINRLRGAFNVSAAGQRAALAALEDEVFVQRSAAHNRAERARFAGRIAGLGNHGITALPSQANFLLVLFEGSVTAQAALEALGQAGYAVRHLPGQGLPHALRITIGTAADMDAVADTLARLVAGTPDTP